MLLVPLAGLTQALDSSPMLPPPCSLLGFALCADYLSSMHLEPQGSGCKTTLCILTCHSMATPSP